MRVCVQFAQATPQQYQIIDVTSTGIGTRAWRNLPKKARPAAFPPKAASFVAGVFTVAAHGYSANDQIIFPGGANPFGSTATVFYATVVTTDTFRLAASSAGAALAGGQDGAATVQKITALDNADGWISAVACQGLVCSGEDAYSIAPRTGPGGGITLMAWSDQIASVSGDPYDYEFRRGQVWQFPPPKADSSLGGRTNTAQQATFYAEAGAGWDYWSHLFPPEGTNIPGGGKVQWADYATFPFPAETETKYGVWIRDPALYDATAAILPPLKVFDT